MEICSRTKESNVKFGLKTLEVRQYLNITHIRPHTKTRKTPNQPKLKLRRSAGGKGDSEMEEAVQVSVRLC